MAHASKASAPPAPTAKPRGPQPNAPWPTASNDAKQNSNPALTLTLWLLALAVITGVTPVLLAGQMLNYWHVPFTAPWPLFGGTPTYNQTLAKPQAMVTTASVTALVTPGAGGASVATLEAGFPVNVTQYASVSGASWAHIRWSGPTATTGGAGWAPAASLKASAKASSQPTGDFAALSPAVARTVTGANFAAAVVYLGSGANYAYRTDSALQSGTLGAQIIPVVLVADYGLNLASQQPSSMPQSLANGDSGALTFIFLSVNKNNGLSAFLAANHVSGFHISSQPESSTASVADLSNFYAQMTQAPMVTTPQQHQIFSLLMGANTGASKFASFSAIGSGELYVTTTHDAKGYTTVVTGQLRPPTGPAIAVAAISADQPTAAKSVTALQGFFTALLATIGQ